VFPGERKANLSDSTEAAQTNRRLGPAQRSPPADPNYSADYDPQADTP